MERYFSHYTFIYPATYLTSHIVELQDNKVISCFPYEKQISNTQFISGLLLLLPEGVNVGEVEFVSEYRDLYLGLLERGSFLVRSFSI